MKKVVKQRRILWYYSKLYQKNLSSNCLFVICLNKQKNSNQTDLINNESLILEERDYQNNFESENKIIIDDEFDTYNPDELPKIT